MIQESKTLIRGPLHNSTIPVELKEGDTYIPLKDESGNRSMPGLVARETESLPKGGPNSIYYEKARQNDPDDVDGWPALSVCLSVIGPFLCYRSRSLYAKVAFCLFLFSSSDPVFFICSCFPTGKNDFFRKEARDMSELYTDSRSRPNEGSEDIVRITSNEGSEDIVLRAVT